MNSIVQPTKNAGELFIPALGRTVQLIEWREDDFYDTVSQAAGAITAGTSLELFRDLTNKNIQHTNLRKPRNIPAGSEFVMNRVGVVILQAYSNSIQTLANVLKVAYAATLTFKINDRLVIERPIYTLPTGYGMYGSTTENAASIVTSGVPNVAAAPQLLVAQPVKDDDDLIATIDFKNDAWITGTSVMPTTATYYTLFTCFMHGLVKKPQGK